MSYNLNILENCQSGKVVLRMQTSVEIYVFVRILTSLCCWWRSRHNFGRSGTDVLSDFSGSQTALAKT